MHLADPGRVAESFFHDRFSIDQSIAADLIATAMSRGGEHAELFFEHRESSNITFEQQAVDVDERISRGRLTGLRM